DAVLAGEEGDVEVHARLGRADRAIDRGPAVDEDPERVDAALRARVGVEADRAARDRPQGRAREREARRAQQRRREIGRLAGEPPAHRLGAIVDGRELIEGVRFERCGEGPGQGTRASGAPVVADAIAVSPPLPPAIRRSREGWTASAVTSVSSASIRARTARLA